MDALSNYLATATDFLEGYRDVDKVKDLYEKDPAGFERMWQELFTDTKSYMVTSFIKILEKKGLYIQYDHCATRNISEVGISLDLRIYRFSKEVGEIACLKVMKHELSRAYRAGVRF